MNHRKKVIARQLALVGRVSCILLPLFMVGCAGRAETTITYSPPAQTAQESQSSEKTGIVVAGKTDQVKVAVAKFLQSVLPEQLDSSTGDNTLRILAAIPPDKLKRFLDCGVFSIHNPDTQTKTRTFAATEPQQSFPLSDATSFPKPAQRTMGALVKISLMFTSDGPNKTGVSVQTAFAIRQELTHYTLVQGFSPMMPYRVSQRVKEEDVFTFDSGTSGESITILPEMRYCINGSFKMQCLSTGSLEREIFQGIKNITISKTQKRGS